MPEFDEFGIPIRKKQNVVENVDEFGIPIKKKENPQPPVPQNTQQSGSGASSGVAKNTNSPSQSNFEVVALRANQARAKQTKLGETSNEIAGISSTMSLNDGANIPVNDDEEKAKAQNAYATSLETFAKNKGLKKESLEFTLENLPNYVPDQWVEQTAKLVEENKLKGIRQAKTLTWQYPLFNGINKAIEKKEITSNDAKFLWNNLMTNQESVTMGEEEKRTHAKNLISQLHKYLPYDEALKLEEAVAVDQSNIYGTLSDAQIQKAKKENVNFAELSDNTIRALEFYKDFKPSMYKSYVQRILPGYKLQTQEQIVGLELTKRQLEEFGIELASNALIEKITDFENVAKKNGGKLNDEDFAKYNEAFDKFKKIEEDKTFLDRKYPNAAYFNDEFVAQELLGEQRFNDVERFGRKTADGFMGIVRNVKDLATMPFDSDEDTAKKNLEVYGRGNIEDAAYNLLASRNANARNGGVEIVDEDFKAEIEKIKSSDLDYQKKLDAIKGLMFKDKQAGKESFKVLEPNTKEKNSFRTKTNEVLDLTSGLIPFVAETWALGGATKLIRGVSELSALEKGMHVFGSTMTTAKEANHRAAIEEGLPDAETVGLRRTAIQGLAFALGDEIGALKRSIKMLPVKQQKLLEGLTDAEIKKALSSPVNKFFTTAANDFKDVIKSSAQMAGIATAANATNNLIEGKSNGEILSQFGHEFTNVGYLNAVLKGFSRGWSGVSTKGKVTDPTLLKWFDAGTKPEFYKFALKEQLDKGMITKEEAIQAFKNIEKANEVYEKSEFIDNNGMLLSEDKKIQAFANKLKQQDLQDILSKDIPLGYKQKVEAELGILKQEYETIIDDKPATYTIDGKEVAKEDFVKRMEDGSIEGKSWYVENGDAKIIDAAISKFGGKYKKTELNSASNEARPTNNVAEKQAQTNTTGVQEVVEPIQPNAEGLGVEPEVVKEGGMEKEVDIATKVTALKKNKPILDNIFGKKELTSQKKENGEPTIAKDRAEREYAENKLSTEDNIEQEPSIKAVEDKANSPARITIEEIEGAIKQTENLINAATDVGVMKVADIKTDEARFQNREGLNKDKVDSIAKKWKDAEQDPIHIWKDPKTNEYFVLSGHHRLAGAELAKRGTVKIQDRSLDFNEQQAIKFAKEEANANRTMETPIERAKLLGEKRKNGDEDLKEFLEREGKNASFIDNLSRLNPKGETLDALRNLDKSEDKVSQKETEKIADWIGEARKKNSKLTNAHEAEMFKFLLGNDRIKTKSDFISKVYSLAGGFDFDPQKPLNIAKFKNITEGEKAYNNEFNNIKQEIINRQDKIDEIKSRFTDTTKKDYVSTEANDYNTVKKIADNKVSDLNNEIKIWQKKLQEHQQQKGKYQGGASTGTLFSYDENGKPTAETTKQVKNVVADFFEEGITDYKKIRDEIAAEYGVDKAEVDNVLEKPYEMQNNLEKVKGIQEKLGSKYPIEIVNSNKISELTGQDADNVLGFTKEGKAYINGELATPETTMQELGRLWIQEAEQSSPILYKRGIELITSEGGDVYLEQVKGSAFYKNQAENARKIAESKGENGQSAYDKYIHDEALERAIEDGGKSFFGDEKTNFVDWLKKLWNNVSRSLGFENITADQLAKMDLKEYSQRAAKDILTKEKADYSKTPYSEDVIGVSNKKVDIQRLQRGEDPLFSKSTEADDTRFYSAAEKVDAGELNPLSIANVIISEKGKARINADDVNAMAYGYAKSMKALDEQASIYEQSVASGNKEAIDDARINRERINAEISSYEQALRLMGTEQSAAFRARQNLILQDYSVTAGIKRWKFASDKTEVSESVVNSFKELSTKIKDGELKFEEAQVKIKELNKKIDYLEKNKSKIENESTFKKQEDINDVVTDVNNAQNKKPISDATKSRYKSERENILNQLRKLKSGGGGSPSNSAKSFFSFVAKNEGGKEKELIKAIAKSYVNEAKEQGIELKPKELAETILNDVYEFMPNASVRTISDAISNYGEIKKPKDSSKAWNLIKSQMLLLSKVDRAKNAEQISKTGYLREKPNETSRDMMKELNYWMDKFGIHAESDNQIKGALDAVKTRLKNQIEELETYLETGVKPLKKDNGIIYDQDANNLVIVRDNLKKDVEALEKANGTFALEQQRLAEKSLDRRIAEIENELRTGIKKQKNTTEPITNEAIEAKKSVLKNLKKIKAETFANTADEIQQQRLAAYKSRLQKMNDKLEYAMLNKSNMDAYIASKKKEVTKLDDEAYLAKIEYTKKKHDFEDILKRAELNNKAEWVKKVDWARQFYKKGITLGVTTLGKLQGAVALRAIGDIVENAAYYGISKAFPTLAKQGTKYIGTRADLIKQFALEYGTLLSKETYSEAWKDVFTGKAKIYNEELLYGKEKKYVDQFEDKAMKLLQAGNNMHAALKYPMFKATYNKTLPLVTEYYLRNNIDVTSLQAKEAIKAEATLEGLKAIFKNDSRAAKSLRNWQGSMRREDGKTQDGKAKYGVGHAISDFTDLNLPVVNVPANYAAETIKSIPVVGLLTRANDLGLAIKKGGEALTKEEATEVTRILAKQTVGTFFALLGWFGYKSIGGYYRDNKDEEKSGDVKKGDLKVGNVEVSHTYLHGVSFEIMNYFGTLRQMIGEEQSFGEIAATQAKGLVSMSPEFKGTQQIVGSLENGATASKYFGTIARNFIPRSVQWAAEKMDNPIPENMKDDPKIKEYEKDNWFKRKPEGFIEQIKMGIPGLREDVKTKADKELDKKGKSKDKEKPQKKYNKDSFLSKYRRGMLSK